MTVEIKKYSNRRLYNTDTSSYITQEDIVDLIKKKINFQITDVDSKKLRTKTPKIFFIVKCYQKALELTI